MFDKIKNFFNKNPTQKVDSASGERIQMVEQLGNAFYKWNGAIYESDMVRACLRPKVKAVGKLVAKHIRDTAGNFQTNPEPYLRFLLEEPNPYMTGQVFQEKMCAQLQLNNNAFAAILRGPDGLPSELYPIPATAVEAIYDKAGRLYLKCLLKNGKTVTFPYTEVIHLRQDFCENDIFGESPMRALAPLMEIVTTTDQGIVNAIKNSAVIRWILLYRTNLNPEDIKARTKEFAEAFLNLDNNASTAAGVDSKAELKQITPTDYVPNAVTMDRTTKRIYSFFGTNEAIIQSKYNEDEWNSYYESEIEPVAVQLSGEMTRKLFNRRERAFGNSIIYESSNLLYASMTTKLNLYQVVDRGAMTPNEWRRILGNLAPVAGGDEPLRRLDTQPVTMTPAGEQEQTEGRNK